MCPDAAAILGEARALLSIPGTDPAGSPYSLAFALVIASERLAADVNDIERAIVAVNAAIGATGNGLRPIIQWSDAQDHTPADALDVLDRASAGLMAACEPEAGR